MNNAEYEERFQEQVQRAREILERQVASQTLEQVNARIVQLEAMGSTRVAENLRRARNKVFGNVDPGAGAHVPSTPA